MRARPAGKSIGAEARMDQSQRRFDRCIAKIRIESRQLTGREHSFVNDGAGREAGNIEHSAFVNSTPCAFADSLANYTKFSFERCGVSKLRCGTRILRVIHGWDARAIALLSRNENLPDY